MPELSLPLPKSKVMWRLSEGMQTLSKGLWRLVKEKPLGAFGGVMVLGLMLCAAFANWIAPFPYDETNVRQRLKPPGAQFYLGTDNLGRDLFSRIVHGARISVTVGFGAVALSVLLATMLGVLSGYFGGDMRRPGAAGSGCVDGISPPVFRAQHHGGDHHHRDERFGWRHPRRGSAELSGVGGAPAVSFLGGDAERLGSLLHV